jgi:uncharacterized protein (DUF433 family)
MDIGAFWMVDTILHIDYIIKTPGVLGGRPRIAGRRIGVEDVAHLHIWQDTPVAEIAEMYDLTPAQIHAALAYYYDHRTEIDASIEEDYRVAKEQIDPDQQAALVAKAQERARARHSQDDEMTATQISQEFGVSTQTVREAAKAGWLSARKSGSTWLIRRAEAKARWGKK